MWEICNCYSTIYSLKFSTQTISDMYKELQTCGGIFTICTHLEINNLPGCKS